MSGRRSQASARPIRTMSVATTPAAIAIFGLGEVARSGSEASASTWTSG